MYIVTGRPPRQVTLAEYLKIPEWIADRAPARIAGGSEPKASHLLIEKHGTGARSQIATARGEGRQLTLSTGGRDGGQLPSRLFSCRRSRS